MTITAYRIVKTKYIATAFTGEGARLAGGRWNPAGESMVYLASSLSLATLELFVHIEDYSIISKLYSYLPVTFDAKSVHTPKFADLPVGWDSREVLVGTQLYGGDWLRSRRSLILAVPSAVTPTETNYLVNPAHPHATRLKTGKPVSFKPDPRLMR